MKPLSIFLILWTLSAADTTMPEYKRYYISGIEFDTKTYCADFATVIEAQNRKIQALQAEVTQLRQQLQQNLSQKLKAEHEAQLQKNNTSSSGRTKSKIIISDKPI